ncbi:MAG: 2-amino-4-hydroxy-6-hydroxymethyldihydropteridine diphosphokinase [Desulfamplus sp.]|nr:2-amino-4-hydroxy-6-hydroxymethyldihydropteridine diphosphokinase [Desulfamplus sp.]MBF0241102.1 2-amino-4-hydroxy-6-hydroxymethyldihydropteridine diphosphokinase [Desulfamplus sp.]
MKSKHTVFISIGSNMGDKYANCIRGIEHINQLHGTKVVDIAHFYKTSPVDYKEQEWFINSALKIETELEPDNLMVTLKNIEEKIGQYEKSVRFGPRIIDLDIIFYDDMLINRDNLTIPHPRMDKRCFVLKPLCDIAPNLIHPILGHSLKELLKVVENDKEQQILFFK